MTDGAGSFGALPLRLEVIDPVDMLDTQFGIWPLKQFPDQLADTLFGQPSEEQLFAVVDGAIIPGLVDFLEAEDLAHKSLYTGDLRDEMGDAQPFLVELTPDSLLLRHLWTADANGDTPTAFLDKAAAILMRSTAPLPALHRHLRRFTQLQTPADARVFFRFWDPVSAARYFQHIARQPAASAAWFHGRSATLSSIIVPVETLTGWSVWTVKLDPEFPLPSDASPPLMDAETEDILRLARYDMAVLEATKLLLRTFPDQLENQDPRRLQADVDTLYRRIIPKGIETKSSLFIIATWEALYGPGFEQRDPDGQLAEILDAEGHEDKRMERLIDRMNALDPTLFTNPRGEIA